MKNKVACNFFLCSSRWIRRCFSNKSKILWQVGKNKNSKKYIFFFSNTFLLNSVQVKFSRRLEGHPELIFGRWRLFVPFSVNIIPQWFNNDEMWDLGWIVH